MEEIIINCKHISKQFKCALRPEEDHHDDLYYEECFFLHRSQDPKRDALKFCKLLELDN